MMPKIPHAPVQFPEDFTKQASNVACHTCRDGSVNDWRYGPPLDVLGLFVRSAVVNSRNFRLFLCLRIISKAKNRTCRIVSRHPLL